MEEMETDIHKKMTDQTVTLDLEDSDLEEEEENFSWPNAKMQRRRRRRRRHQPQPLAHVHHVRLCSARVALMTSSEFVPTYPHQHQRLSPHHQRLKSMVAVSPPAAS